MLPSPRDVGSARRHSGASTDRLIRTSTIGTSASQTEPSSHRAIEPSSRRIANRRGARTRLAAAHRSPSLASERRTTHFARRPPSRSPRFGRLRAMQRQPLARMADERPNLRRRPPANTMIALARRGPWIRLPVLESI
ncbi:hypothetical protein [Burkholderia pseudomallei]|uniref:hypothetical protein n=1 Tax=Burkholderia pseudomallei TaxID=28450 RepID=UPI00168B54D8|nr:hypothetical protein [Burkholderia pseudomallei]MBD2945621.1 hypothetical protein [Burkholderia pseudomallei]MBD2951758.1 hypothetical protein [Burkholderia pseudomallei]MBD2989053.1 hypothetical protein [Burkholderia pseudomallei]MBD2992088.1 hypothetical protein [Burkholderia pseudomallei]